MIKIGLIGTGNIADLHATSINKLEDSKVTRVYDINKCATDKFVEQFKEVAVAGSLEGILNSNIDIIGILSPPKTHYAILEKAIFSGIKNIFCEKPFVLDEEQLDKLRELTSEHDKRIFIGQSYRFFEHTKLLKELVSKKQDKLKYFEIEYRKPTDKNNPPRGWRSEYEDYIILENGVHMIDLARFITNKEIKEVHAYSTNISKIIKGVDTATINLKLGEESIIGSIRLNQSCKERFSLYSGNHHYYFEDSSLHIENNTLYGIEKDENKKLYLENVKDRWSDSFKDMWQSFIHSVKENGVPEVGIKENYGTIRAVCGSMRSTKENRVIDLRVGQA